MIWLFRRNYAVAKPSDQTSGTFLGHCLFYGDSIQSRKSLKYNFLVLAGFITQCSCFLRFALSQLFSFTFYQTKGINAFLNAMQCDRFVFFGAFKTKESIYGLLGLIFFCSMFYSFWTTESNYTDQLGKKTEICNELYKNPAIMGFAVV